MGVPWLGWTDGTCRYCTSGRENLCEHARFTGRDIDGGFAEWTLADPRYCFELPDGMSDAAIAPLLCGGLIGYRALRMCGEPERLGLYGFGSAASMICQVAAWQGREVYAFTRDGDTRGQDFARSLGAHWAVAPPKPPPSPSTPRSSSPPPARWSRPPCARCPPAVGWCARASTCPTSPLFPTTRYGWSARSSRWPT